MFLFYIDYYAKFWYYIFVEKVDEILKDACEGINFENLTIFYQGLSKININLEKAYNEKYGNELGEENNE